MEGSLVFPGCARVRNGARTNNVNVNMHLNTENVKEIHRLYRRTLCCICGHCDFYAFIPTFGSVCRKCIPSLSNKVLYKACVIERTQCSCQGSYSVILPDEDGNLYKKLVCDQCEAGKYELSKRYSLYKDDRYEQCMFWLWINKEKKLVPLEIAFMIGKFVLSGKYPYGFGGPYPATAIVKCLRDNITWDTYRQLQNEFQNDNNL